MNRKSILVFLDVYKSGSFTRAARNNDMTVQNVSKIITNLESEVGFTLFERTQRGSYPTDAASAFLYSAKILARAFFACEAQANKIKVSIRRKESP